MTLEDKALHAMRLKPHLHQSLIVIFKKVLSSLSLSSMANKDA